MSAQDAAWDLVFEFLPVRWRIGKGRYDPGSGTYSVSAIGPAPRHGGPGPVVTGTGSDLTGALHDLDAQLRGAPRAEGGMDDTWRQARFAYYCAAEEWSRATIGRPLTAAELEGILLRYLGR